MAEDAVRELPNLPLEDALQLVHLYAERADRRSTSALRCGGSNVFLAEGSPRLQHLAEISVSLAKRESEAGGRD